MLCVRVHVCIRVQVHATWANGLETACIYAYKGASHLMSPTHLEPNLCKEAGEKDFASFNCPEHLIHVQSYQVISSKITQLNATFAGLYSTSHVKLTTQ